MPHWKRRRTAPPRPILTLCVSNSCVVIIAVLIFILQNAMVVDPPPKPQTVATVPIPDGDNLDKLPLMRTSVIIAMVMLLKAHLKSIYSISEEYVKVP
jgi:hypothetical protein